jgi:hypothetical protein
MASTRANTTARSRKKSSTRRERIAPRGDTRFVRRDGGGRFNESDDAGRSLRVDRRKKARKKVASGHGDRGDRRRSA